VIALALGLDEKFLFRPAGFELTVLECILRMKMVPTNVCIRADHIHTNLCVVSLQCMRCMHFETFAIDLMTS
jgi:hypothetical protein